MRLGRRGLGAWWPLQGGQLLRLQQRVRSAGTGHGRWRHSRLQEDRHFYLQILANSEAVEVAPRLEIAQVQYPGDVEFGRRTHEASDLWQILAVLGWSA
jgi:hypothetical protein